jgi:hypothetical protein
MLVLAYVLAFVGISLVVSFLVLAEACRRYLVDYQFANHHDSWLETGRPLGGKATRAEASFFGSDFAAFATFGWLFERPAWLPRDSCGEVLRRRAVRYLLLAPLGIIPLGAAVLLFFRFAP